MTWAERRRERAAEAAAPISNGFNHNGSSYSLNEIEQMVENGAPAGANRSNLFHTIVGHYIGCGWSDEQILSHIQQFPNGIGGRYLSEGRLSGEIARSVSKYNAVVLPSVDTAPKAKTPQPEPDSEDDDEELNDDEPSNSDLPPLYGHGDQDGQPFKSWLIKNLIPACGHGLLSGQWGAGKTFVVFDLAAALGTCQPFLGHPVKRQCGVLLIAAEGANEVRLRLDAVIRTKCGNMQRAPFRWYETVPMLLHKGSVEKLIAMAKQAEASLLQEFGLPLGLIIIDTIAACAGYARAGDENDPAAGQAVMNILKAVAETIGCFVLGVDHFGKNLEAGTRGASSKEASGDLVLACLGDKEVSGSVVNTRLAVRKNRAGRQGQEYPFVLRMVQTPEPDEDGEPVSTMVVDWVPASPSGAQPDPDPWAQSRRQDQRTAVLRLKRALMGLLADQGVELSIPPDGPLVRMIDQEIVRQQFYDHTPADGTPEQKAEFKRKRFNRAIDWVEDQQLIAVPEIDSITHLRLSRPEPEDHEQEDD